MAVKAALGTNTPDPLKLFNGWEQGALAGVVPGLSMGSGNGFIGGFGQPDFLQRLNAEAGQIPLPPGVVPFVPQGQGAGQIPGTGNSVPSASPAQPMGGTPSVAAETAPAGSVGPTLQNLPDAPEAPAPLPVPVYDEAKAKADAQRALNISLLPSALATLFNIHGGDFARAEAPALMAAALQASDEQSQDNYKRALQTFGIEQDQQNLADSRAQRAYGQKTNQVLGANEIAQQTFNNVLKVQSIKDENDYKKAVLAQKDVATQLRDSAAYRRAILSMDPASQEAELSSEKAKALGITPFYDEDGNYVPLRLSKDVTTEERARIARMTGENQNRYRDTLGVVAQGNLGNNTARTESTVKKNDATIDQGQQKIELEKQKIAIDRQRANTMEANGKATRAKAAQSIRTMGKSKDPLKAQAQLTGLIAAARVKQASAAKVLDDPTAGEFSRQAAQAEADSYEKAIASYAMLRDLAIQDARASGVMTDFQGRGVSNRALVTTPAGTTKLSSGTTIKAVSRAGASRSPSGQTVGPAKVNLPAPGGVKLTPEAAGKMTVEELKKIMLGAK